MAGIISFLESPLVIWVRTFGDDKDPPDFQELCDGVFLNDVMGQIDHRELDIENDIRRSAKDTNAKIQNWSVLMKSINSYYQDVLQQLVVMETPDIFSIVKDPTKECSLSCMKKVLLLLLGCAIQCDHKEDYINIIKTMDINIQQAIVASIQQVTDTCDNVLDMDGAVGEKQLVRIIRTTVEERNNLTQRLLPLMQERDYYKHELVEKRGAPLSPPVHLEKYQLYRDVCDWKQKNNRLVEDVEEKSKVISDLQEDVHDLKEQLLRVKSENVALGRDAKAVQSYRDELDSLKERALRVERCEKDITRYKERLVELEFYKGRVEELRKDNDALLEARSHAEDQLATCQKKAESVMDEVVRIQVQLDESNKERDQMCQKLRELVEENSMLEFEKCKMNEGYGSSGIRRFTSTTSIDLGSPHFTGHSISDELQETMVSQVTRVEMERDELKQELDDAKLRLQEAQHMLKTVQDQTEREIQRKVAELDNQSKRHRNQTSQQLTDEYHHKMLEMEQCRAELKKGISKEYKVQLAELEQEKQRLQVSNQQLESRLDFVHISMDKDKEQCQRLAHINEDLVQEKDHCKAQIRMIQNSSEQRIQELEAQVQATQQTLRSRDTLQVCSLCDQEMNDNSISHETIDTDAGVRKLTRLRDSCDGSPVVRSSSGSGSRPDVVSQSVQTSPSPAWISYCGDGMHLPPDAKYNDENKNKKSSSSSKSKFLDILRPKSISSNRQGSPVPTRPATVLGVVHENRSTTIQHRGVCTPQRRSVPNTPPESPFKEPLPFRRNDRLRSTIHHSGGPQQRSNVSHPTSHTLDYIPFSRDDRLRSTMPEKRSGYVPPERRRHMAPPGSRSSISSVETSPSHRHHNERERRDSTDLDSSILAYLDRALCPPDVSREVMYSSDRDSGCATSPDTPTSNGHPHTPTRGGHQLTGFEVLSSETIKTQIRTSMGLKAGDKWRVLVDKIVELQDKNNKLQGNNSELRKSLNTVKFSEDRMGLLEKRNLELEVENRKLNKIVESLQSSLEGLNPYDKRTYHFYSNV